MVAKPVVVMTGRPIAGEVVVSACAVKAKPPTVRPVMPTSALTVIGAAPSDTETVVELALEMWRGQHPLDQRMRIADIGTGSGAILLALLSEMPEAEGVGTDISLAALRTAKANAARLGFAERAVFIACNYTAALSGPFDLMVSNPPYIRSADIPGLESEVRNFDPLAALNGGADGLDAYRAIIPAAAGLLGPAGALIVEAGLGQSGQIQGLMTASGLTLERNPKADLAGVPRAVAGRKAPR